jgi:DNA excision repair protein ERCC-3
VAIQVSGTFGSRQEEAQRLGRILRPKGLRNISYFYSLISRDTTEQEFAQNRQLFLTEQGYRYLIESRFLDESGALSEPVVWRQLLQDTGPSTASSGLAPIRLSGGQKARKRP